ncbi:MAG TPA: glycosyltransferase family 2 protein [Actinomycetota bacterium]|nr:glycosyltransferase family 2 protein [Actinomycetota bacterium]
MLGIVAGVALFLVAIRGYDRRRISRLGLIVATVLCLGLVILSLRPSAFDPIFGWFDVQPGDERRLIFVLVLAVLVLFFLLLGVQSEADTNERSIRMLVEALGRERFDWARAAALPEGRRLVVVSPAFNEEESIGDVLRDLPADLGGLQVIAVVVSDGSEDATARVAREAGAFVTELPIRRGGGLALRVGYEIALRLGAEIIVTMDADGQHLASELPVMVAPILDGDADYVNGSRLLGEFERESLIRHVGLHLFSRVITVLTGRRITDPSSGYRAARADLLERLVLKQDQFWTSEILIEALRQRARVVEVPVTIVARTAGDTKKPRSLRYGWNFSKVIVQTWLR